MTRGIKHDVDRMISDLQAQYFPYKFKDPKDNVDKEMLLQLSVRPIQLWELGFPEPELNNVLSMLYNGDPIPKHHTFAQKMRLEVLRKMLQAKKIPKYDEWKECLKRPIYKDNVAIYPIGTKEDEIRTYGEGV